MTLIELPQPKPFLKTTSWRASYLH